MAPNSEEDGSRLSTVQDAGWSLEEANKEQLRPPVYNPEDYAAALRKWGRRGAGAAAAAVPGVAALAADGGSPRDHHRRHGHGHTTSQHQHQQQPPQQQPEMSLRQFSSASELLAKLRADLRLAYPSFVQEFIGDPLDGVTLLLELLRAVQQPAPGQGGGAGAGGGGGGGGAGGGRRALLDELACLQCLHACLRLPDAARRLARSPAGLYTLAVCVMSNATKSRVIALQLLTRACEPPGCGHAAVSEALSTLRLRLAEPVRFRLLAGMLGSAGGCPDLPAAGLRFLNTLLETAPGEQARLYLLAELRQAGFQPHALAQVLPAGSAAAQQLQAELSRWQRNQVDVAQLRARAAAAEAESRALREQVAILEQRVQILQEEKGVLVSLERCLKDRCSELEATVKRQQQQQQHQQQRQQQKQTDAGGGGSTPAEDEGISSSDQEHSLEEREPMVYELFHVHNDTILMQETSVDDGPEPGEAEGCVVGGGAGVVGGGAAADEDEETTIDEVIEELRNIINDAETEAYAAEAAAVAKAGKRKEEPLVIAEERPAAVGFTVRIQALEREAEIVPARLLPQPPRRARSLVQLAPRAHAHYVSSSAAKSASFFFDDEDDDEESPVHSSEEEDSDSLLSSAARDHCGTKKWTVREAKSTAALRLKLAGAPAGERGGGRPVRRSESFHQVLAGDPERRQRLQGRCGSFDGLFCVTDSPRSRPRSPPSSTAVVPTLARNRHHSKSLDCIDEGLHALVDVVVASTAATAATSVSVSAAAAAAAQDRRSSGRGSTTDEWSLEWDKNYLAAAGAGSPALAASPPPPPVAIVPVSRFPAAAKRYPPDGASKPPVYLPAATRKNSFDAPFLVRGGHGNAGLYSGRQALSREAIAKHSARARSASSAGATPGRKVSVSVKVTDLPSGLY
ncbi:uncharacterized protein LOC126334988 isoform X2 [Schistocerca gregaria]|nr:uncharacterized protein LOC126334988 isoform X2 [Schistocerca gregaria]XP_049853755.1 uncharacterized protein LOC126334988 isoform X2 [Schistocerca gregaria]